MSIHSRTASVAVGPGPDSNVFPHSPDTVNSLHPNPTAQPEFKNAIQFVKKIKKRFAHETDTYGQFLEVLQQYQKEQLPYPEVYKQVTSLLQSAPDLTEEFEQSPLHLSRLTPPSGGVLAAPAGTHEIYEEPVGPLPGSSGVGETVFVVRRSLL